MSTDHKAEAEAMIPSVAQGSFDQTRDYIALAQVHATLALVEQHRIANIIALASQQRVDTGLYETTTDEDTFDFVTHLAPEIRKGLGL